MATQTPSDKNPPVEFLDMYAAELAAIGYRVPNGAADGSDISRYFQSDPNADAFATLNQKILSLTLVENGSNRGPTALCLSGGGIRSATLNLGTLQALASSGILPKFDYLSTVSGGGYIGGWLSAWVKRKGGIDTVATLLNQPRSGREPEAAEIRHLREFSNYLAPRKGLLSPDTWTLVATYLRNLILNWFVLIPLFAAALCVPRLLVALHYPLRTLEGDLTLWRWGLGLAFVLLTGFAFGNAGRMLPSSRARRSPPGPTGNRLIGLWHRYSRPAGTQSDFLWRCLLPLVLGALALSLYWRLHVPRQIPWSDRAYWYFLTGLAAAAFGAFFFPGSGRKAFLTGVGAAVAGGAVAGAGLLGTAMVLRLINRELRESELQTAISSVHVTVVVPLVLSALSLGATLYIGLTSRLSAATDDDREWWGRFGAWVSIVSVVWLVGCAIVLLLPALLLEAGSIGQSLLSVLGGASGLTAVLLGKSPDTDGTTGREANPTKTQRLKELLLSLTAPAFIVLLAGGLSVALSLLMLLTPLAEFVPEYTGDLNAKTHFGSVARICAPVVLGITAVLAAVGVLLGWWINSNRFSLHAMYRDRLIRAYLGALEKKDRSPDLFTGFDPDDNIFMHRLAPDAIALHELSDDALDRIAAHAHDRRTAHKTTKSTVQRVLVGLRIKGDDLGTDVSLGLSKHTEESLGHSLATRARHTVSDPKKEKAPYPAEIRQQVLDELNDFIFGVADSRSIGSAAQRATQVRSQLRAGDEPPPARLRPFHIVNTALNTIRNNDMAWQDRKADSFTISPLHCGSSRLGYRPAVLYGGDRGISLGTAITISGAAASPNMGYHSSPPVTFLLALFNVRLGSWLGNPKDAEASARNAPKLGLLHLISEFFGFVDANHKYVYLSDGGHFENLGLYEMIRRRCRTIVVVDAGCDEKFNFDDLGNAVRKIRADLGVDIRFPGPVPIEGRDSELNRKGSRVAYGTIDYSRTNGPDGGAAPAYTGRLVYIKSSFYGNESADVYSYARANPQFPHESTADQFFSESQFESYRALGQEIVRDIQATNVAAKDGQDLLDTFVARAEEMADQALKARAGA